MRSTTRGNMPAFAGSVATGRPAAKFVSSGSGVCAIPVRCSLAVWSRAQGAARVVASLVNAFLASGGRRSAQELADPDSCFKDVDGVLVHYKDTGAAAAGADAVFGFAHGFGANLYTFEDVIGELSARERGVRCVSYDSPGFGLTSRPSLTRLRQYKMQFGAAIMRSILPAESRGPVLVGFSLGARSVATYAIEASAQASTGSKPSAIVLIAPGLLPGRGVRMRQDGGPMRGLDGSGAGRRWQAYFSVVVLQVVRYVVVGISVLLNPLLNVFLRVSISGVKFWTYGLGLARGDPKTLTPRMLEAYRKPLQVQKWAAGILNFTRAMILEPPSDVVDLTTGLGEMCTDIPTLILHGTRDRIIPLSNSKRLVQRIPHARLISLEGLGHVPHEEEPGRVASIIRAWVMDQRS